MYFFGTLSVLDDSGFLQVYAAVEGAGYSPVVRDTDISPAFLSGVIVVLTELPGWGENRENNGKQEIYTSFKI
mgnify:CR=1 FL=1